VLINIVRLRFNVCNCGLVAFSILLFEEVAEAVKEKKIKYGKWKRE